jgi:TfoX/Sxy family transcriptional regulator of competence genes
VSVEEMFAAVAGRLVEADARLQTARMFGSTGLRTESGKFAGFARDDELVVKLPAERVTELLESGEGAVFDAGRGRPMKEWVVLHPRDEGALERYLLEAREFVAKS